MICDEAVDDTIDPRSVMFNPEIEKDSEPLVGMLSRRSVSHKGAPTTRGESHVGRSYTGRRLLEAATTASTLAPTIVKVIGRTPSWLPTVLPVVGTLFGGIGGVYFTVMYNSRHAKRQARESA